MAPERERDGEAHRDESEVRERIRALPNEPAAVEFAEALTVDQATIRAALLTQESDVEERAHGEEGQPRGDGEFGPREARTIDCGSLAHARCFLDGASDILSRSSAHACIIFLCTGR